MSERAEFDISKYMIDGVICLENMKIENCDFTALQSEWQKRTIRAKNASLKICFLRINVVGDSWKLLTVNLKNVLLQELLEKGK